MSYNSIPKSELDKLDKLVIKDQYDPIEAKRVADKLIKQTNDKVDSMMGVDYLREVGY